MMEYADDAIEMVMRVLRPYGFRSDTVAYLIVDVLGADSLCPAVQRTVVNDSHACACVDRGEHDLHWCPCGLAWREVGGCVTISTHDQRVDHDTLNRVRQ